MKTTILFTTALMLGAFSAIPVTAQTIPPARLVEPRKPTTVSNGVPCAKIALINTEAFSDEKGGITRYVHAIKSLEREFQGRHPNLNYLRSRIKVVTEEITKLSDGGPSVDPKMIQARKEERERLQREFNSSQEYEDAYFRKRYDEVVSPVASDISKALDQFAARHGISLLLDKSKLAPAILVTISPIDVTEAFIAEYNREQLVDTTPSHR